MSFPLWVLPSENTFTPSWRIAPIIAVVVTARPNGVVLADANAGEIARSLAQEAAAVASAMRIALPFNDPWSYVRSIVEQTLELRNSMLADLDAGVKTENDHISGAVVAAGRRAAVPTPCNETMFRLIRIREAIGDIAYNWRDTAAQADSLSERNP